MEVAGRSGQHGPSESALGLMLAVGLGVRMATRPEATGSGATDPRYIPDSSTCDPPLSAAVPPG